MRTPHSHPGIAALAAALLVVVSTPGAGQTATDSAPRVQAPADSAVAGYGDRARQAGVDTSRGRPVADSGLKAPAESSGNSSAPAQSGAPTDSVLSSACTSMRPGGVAPGLLLVLFRDSAGEKERSDALSEAGGVAAGPAPGGGEYVRAASDTISTRTLADGLVLNAAIASISERTCPRDGR
jgi:hypothetical protein